MPDKDKRKKERVKSEPEEQQERMLGGYNQETIDFIKGIKPDNTKAPSGKSGEDWVEMEIDVPIDIGPPGYGRQQGPTKSGPVSLHSSDHPVTAMTDTKLSPRIAKHFARMALESQKGDQTLVGGYEEDLMVALAKLSDEYPDAEQTRENAERVLWGMLPLEYIETGELRLRPSSRDKGRPR